MQNERFADFENLYQTLVGHLRKGGADMRVFKHLMHVKQRYPWVMFMCVYVYLYVSVYVYVSICIYVWIYICIFMCIQTFDAC